MELTVFVQHVPGRPSWEKMREELEKSDVGPSYQVVSHIPGTSRKDNFLRLLGKMSRTHTEYVLRLEDDCSQINRHIAHNFLTWPALQDPRFGIGWGFRPGGGKKWVDKWHDGPLHASLATLFRRADLPLFIEKISAMDHPQDIAMSLAASELGKSICIHSPSLVENDIEVPSVSGSFGHTIACHTTRGHFDLEWKRP